jgi:hypothetical protein
MLHAPPPPAALTTTLHKVLWMWMLPDDIYGINDGNITVGEKRSAKNDRQTDYQTAITPIINKESYVSQWENLTRIKCAKSVR